MEKTSFLSPQMPPDSLHTALKEIGLTENESLIYTISLDQGPMSIAAMAERSGIQRPNVYKVLIELEKKGLANFSERKWRSKSFVVEPPTKVRELLEAKTKDLASAQDSLLGDLPNLLARYSQGDRETKINIFKYEREWSNLFFRTLDEADGHILWFGNYDTWLSFMPKDQEDRWIQKRIERGIKIKLLLLPGENTSTFKRTESEQLREFKTVESGLPFDCSFQIYANKIIIWQPKSPLILLIEDEHIVKMFRAMFFIMWNAA